MAVTYFGYCDPTTGAGTGVDESARIDITLWESAGYVCPGSGPQTVVTLGVEGATGATGNVRMAIYTAARALVAYGTAEKAAADGWVDWAAEDITWVIGTTLTGGTTYLLIVTSDGNTTWEGTNSGGAQKVVSTDYTNDAWPDPMAAGGDYTRIINMRCGVTPAAGAGIAVIVGQHARKRRD